MKGFHFVIDVMQITNEHEVTSHQQVNAVNLKHCSHRGLKPNNTDGFKGNDITAVKV